MASSTLERLADQRKRNRRTVSVNIGIAARRARMALRMTQEEVGDLLGVTSEYYARIERGDAMPSLQRFCKMLAIFRISADVLLGLSVTYGHATNPQEATDLRDTFQWKKLTRRLRRARPEVLHLVEWLIGAIQEVGGVPGFDGERGDDREDTCKGEVQTGALEAGFACPFSGHPSPQG